MKKFVALATAAVLSATVLAAQAEKGSTKTKTVQTQTEQVSTQTPAADRSFTVGNTAASDVPASAASSTGKTR